MTEQCSVVTANSGIKSVPVFSRHKCCIPPQSEMAVHVESVTAPTETTAALIEPLIVTFEDIESSAENIEPPAVPKAVQNMTVARTVCHWSSADKTAVVQVANPSSQYVYLERRTVLGHIAPVSVALTKTTSAVQTESKTT